MKKSTLIAIAGVATLSLALQGCSSTSNDSGSGAGSTDGAGKTLTVMMQANGIYPDEQKQWFSDISAEFKKETGAEVVFETFASSAEELTKIQTSVTSGQGPDIYSLGTTFTPTAAATGAFVTLTDKEWDLVGGRDRFVPATLQMSGASESTEVGIPFSSRPFVMSYNTELLSAAGIDKPATTWDEFASQAKKLTSGDVYGISLAYADGFDPWKFIWAMSVQAGNPILDGKTARLDDPVTLKAYETYFGWLTKDQVVDPQSVSWKSSQAIAAFSEGKAAYLPMATGTSKVTLDNSSVAGKYAYAVMPTIPPGSTTLPSDGKAATSIISGDNIVVANYSENQELAFALVKLLTSDSVQQDRFTLFGELPTSQDAAAKVQTDNPELEALIKSSAQSVGTPFSGAWGDTQNELVNVVTQTLPSLSSGSVNQGDLKSLLGSAQDVAQTALDKVR